MRRKIDNNVFAKEIKWYTWTCPYCHNSQMFEREYIWDNVSHKDFIIIECNWCTEHVNVHGIKFEEQ